MANYTPKRKYTKRATTKKTAVKKEVVVPVKELSLLEKAVSWLKNIVK